MGGVYRFDLANADPVMIAEVSQKAQRIVEADGDSNVVLPAPQPGHKLAVARGAEGLIDSSGLGREGRGWCHYGLVFDRCQLAQGALPTAAVVGVFDPGHDRDAKLFACAPAAGV